MPQQEELKIFIVSSNEVRNKQARDAIEETTLSNARNWCDMVHRVNGVTKADFNYNYL